MPEDLGKGLYLALVGMGLVFFSLVAFMLILLALRRLFPSEEIAEAIETDEDPVMAAIKEMEAEEEPATVERSPAEFQGQLAPPGGPTGGRIPGAKVAAIAVALYLAMDQEGDVAHPPVVPNAWTPSRDYSDWSIQGRASHWESQGRRPQAYGQRSQSAYPPRNRLRE